MTVIVPEQAYVDALGADPELAPVLLAIAANESGYNPQAIGDQGRSFGYLQFFTAGGLGDGHAPAELLDGPANMRLGAAYLRSRLATGASLYAALQPWSTRAADWALYERMLAEGVAPDHQASQRAESATLASGVPIGDTDPGSTSAPGLLTPVSLLAGGGNPSAPLLLGALVGLLVLIGRRR